MPGTAAGKKGPGREWAARSLVIWSALCGLISLVATITTYAAYLNGTIVTDLKPHSTPEALVLCVLASAWLNVLALPLTIPTAAVGGGALTWLVSRYRRPDNAMRQRPSVDLRKRRALVFGTMLVLLAAAVGTVVYKKRTIRTKRDRVTPRCSSSASGARSPGFRSTNELGTTTPLPRRVRGPSFERRHPETASPPTQESRSSHWPAHPGLGGRACGSWLQRDAATS